MGVISEAKAAVELAKELGSYLKKAGEHDPNLMGMFEDLRGKVLSLYESDIELRQQMRELKEKLTLREEVFFDQDKGAYFTGTPKDIKGGPFCAKCYTEKDKLVPMKKHTSHSVQGGGYSPWDESVPQHTYRDLWVCVSCGSALDR